MEGTQRQPRAHEGDGLSAGGLGHTSSSYTGPCSCPGMGSGLGRSLLGPFLLLSCAAQRTPHPDWLAHLAPPRGPHVPEGPQGL